MCIIKTATLISAAMLLLLVSGCTNANNPNEAQWPDHIIVEKSEIILDESQHVFLVPYYLKIQNDHNFFLTEANGSFVGKYSLSRGRLLSSFELDSLDQLDELVEQQGLSISASPGAGPAACGITCNDKGECYLAFFKDYLVAHEDMNQTAPLAFIMDISDSLNGPVYFIKHPDFSPWDTITDSWAGLDGGFFCLANTLYVNNSQEDAGLTTSVLLKYALKKRQFLFEGMPDVKAAESWSKMGNYPYIMISFYADDNHVFLTDGRMIYDVTNKKAVFDEHKLNDGEIIMSFSVYQNKFFMLTGQKADTGFDKQIRIIDVKDGLASKPIPFKPKDKMYTYVFNKNVLYFITKGDNIKLSTYQYEY